MSISSVATGEKSDDGLKAIVKYIPTEVIAIYVAILAVYDPLKRAVDDAGAELPLHQSDFGSRWVLFWVMTAATPLITLLIFVYRAKMVETGPSAVRWDKWVYASLAAIVGLAVWASALPDSPGFDFEFWKVGISGIALLIFSLVMPMIGKLIKLDEFT